MPLMLALTGARSSELGGLRIDDIHTNVPIPYIRIFWNGERRVKTGASVRNLPVHPELIRLGFLDYVAAIRAEGQRLLFPELEPGRDTSATFASVYYKHFKYLRDFAFPHGTSALVIKGGRKSDKDVHSFRGMVTNLLKGVRSETRTAILGHNQRTTAADVYEDFGLEELLAALAHTSHLTSHMQPMSINLNPIALGPVGEWRHRTCADLAETTSLLRRRLSALALTYAHPFAPRRKTPRVDLRHLCTHNLAACSPAGWRSGGFRSPPG